METPIQTKTSKSLWYQSDSVKLNEHRVNEKKRFRKPEWNR